MRWFARVSGQNKEAEMFSVLCRAPLRSILLSLIACIVAMCKAFWWSYLFLFAESEVYSIRQTDRDACSNPFYAFPVVSLG